LQNCNKKRTEFLESRNNYHITRHTLTNYNITLSVLWATVPARQRVHHGQVRIILKSTVVQLQLHRENEKTFLVKPYFAKIISLHAKYSWYA